MEKVFITGGAGFIGSHTVDALIARGKIVTVFDRKSWSEATNLHHVEGKVSYIQGDICDREVLMEVMKGHTHVLHLAAIVSVPQTIQNPLTTHDINVTGTLNVFDAARLNNVTRIAYASSAAVYGNQSNIPVSEHMSVAPLSPYGEQKAICERYAELYVELYKQSIIGLRYFNVFGQRQDPSSPYSGVITIFKQKASKNETLTIYGDGYTTRDFVYVSDIVEANMLALESESTGVCNIGAGEEVSLREIVSTLETILDTQVKVEYKPQREGDINRSVANIERAHELLGYVPRVSLENGLRNLCERVIK
jgi:UDP-glucose 4-epimerase